MEQAFGKPHKKSAAETGSAFYLYRVKDSYFRIPKTAFKQTKEATNNIRLDTNVA
jgi:hypothetical protein